MADKSATFGGRLQALQESADVFSAKVGKSFIVNTSAGQFLDKLATSIQKLDTKGLDKFFAHADKAIGGNLARLGRGLAGAIGVDLKGPVNFDAVDAALRKVVDAVPPIIDSAKNVASVFLQLAAISADFAATLLRVNAFLVGVVRPAQPA